jgi:hypothetical protein
MPLVFTRLVSDILAERFRPSRVAVAGLFFFALGLAVAGTAAGAGVLILRSLVSVAEISLTFLPSRGPWAGSGQRSGWTQIR